MSFRPDWEIIRSLFKFGLPAGFQGIAMNLGGVLMYRYIGSLRYSGEAQAAYAVVYSQLFSLITWTSVGLMGAAAAVAGQNLGAGHPERSARSAHLASMMGLGVAVTIGALFVAIPRPLLVVFGMGEGVVSDIAVELLGYLAVSGLFVTVALTYTGGFAGDRRHPQPPVYLDRVPGDRATWDLRGRAGDLGSRGAQHLAGHPHRPHDPVRPQRDPVPARQMARHRRRHRSGASLTPHG